MVFSSVISDEERDKVINKLTKVIADQGGTVVKLEHWGKRKLSHSVGKQAIGYYVYIFLEMAPAGIKELERNCRLTDTIIRHLITVEQKGTKMTDVSMEAKEQKEETEEAGGKDDQSSDVAG